MNPFTRSDPLRTLLGTATHSLIRGGYLSLGLSLAASIGGCHHPDPAASPAPAQGGGVAPSAADISVIQIEFGPCMSVSSCPAYSYTFRRAGTARYEGLYSSKTTLYAEALLSAEAFDAAARRVLKSGFFQLERRYSAGFDGRTNTVTVWHSGDSTAVSADKEAAPSNFAALQAVLDSLGNSLSWQNSVNAQ